MAKYLDLNGLQYLWTNIKSRLAGKVDKQDGKALSTNDFTTAEKNKLAGIASGANKYTLPSKLPASMITQNSGHRFVTDAEKNSWTSASTVVTTSKNGLMESSDKIKLNGVASGAQVNVLEMVKLNGTVLSPSSKAVNIDLSSYAKKSDIGSVYRYKGSVASASKLPTGGNTVGDTYNTTNTGANYAWTGTVWDKLSETIDLSPYALKTEMATITNAEIDSIVTS